jgi:ribosomal protein S18 acetylase RimI-like enzyme
MITLRQATDDDRDFLFALHRVAIRPYVEPIWGWDEEWQQAYFEQEFDAGQRQIIVIDGQDAGVLIVETQPDRLYLALIELLPVFQRLGAGTALINQLKANAHARGQPLALHVLRTNKPARRLYESLGFQLAGEEENRYYLVCIPA